MLKFKHHCIVDEYEYDRQGLKDLFEQFPKECHLPWNAYKTAIKGETHSHQPRGDGGLSGIFSPLYEGKQMKDYEPVQEVLSHFSFIEPLDDHDITFMTYQPGFKFKNHTDRYLEYNIMFPIIPEDAGEPITFYQGSDKDRDNPLGKEYTYNYSTRYPTIFNGKTIHSVDTIKNYRVMFRIKVTSESYFDMIERYEKKLFIK